MTRLIDADALEKELCPGCEYNKNKYANCDDCAIANAPTIDAVEVVRCKECQFSEIFQNDSSGVRAMYCIAFTFDRMVAEDDYCSYGERREP